VKYPNGKLMIRRFVTRDAEGNQVNDGSFTQWSPTGQVLARGEFRMGKAHGSWMCQIPADVTLLNESPYGLYQGPFISQATFVDGALHGNWAIFDAQRKKISEWGFVNGKRQGKWTWWYPNGGLMREMTFAKSLIQGQVRQWNTSGKQVLDENYLNGRLVTVVVKYHDESRKQKKFEGLYLNAKLVVNEFDNWWNANPGTYVASGKRRRHGNWTYWHENGQMELRGNYRGGKRHGQWTWWFADGQRRVSAIYEAGKPVGLWRWWQEDGQVAKLGYFLPTVAESPSKERLPSSWR